MTTCNGEIALLTNMRRGALDRMIAEQRNLEENAISNESGEEREMWSRAVKEMYECGLGACHRRLLVWVKRYFPAVIPTVVIMHYYNLSQEMRSSLTSGDFDPLLDILRETSEKERESGFSEEESETGFFDDFCKSVRNDNGNGLTCRHLVHNVRVFQYYHADIDCTYEAALTNWKGLFEGVPYLCPLDCLCEWCRYWRDDFENMRLFTRET